MDGAINLLATTTTKDAYGVHKESFTKNQVFCTVNSVTRTEFFSAGRNGLNPEYMFEVFAGDYSGERTLEYNGATYAIYRTYRPLNSDYIELYAQTEGGTNGKSDTGQLQSTDTGDT